MGVGTSIIQLDMVLDGYRHVHSIDYSEVVIRHMVEQHAGAEPLTYEVADCRYKGVKDGGPLVEISTQKAGAGMWMVAGTCLE